MNSEGGITSFPIWILMCTGQGECLDRFQALDKTAYRSRDAAEKAKAGFLKRCCSFPKEAIDAVRRETAEISIVQLTMEGE